MRSSARPSFGTIAILAVAVLFFVIGAVNDGSAQFTLADQNAAIGMQNTLTGGSTGPPPSTFMNRFAQQPPGPPGGGMPGTFPPMGIPGVGVATAPGAAAQPAAPAVPKILVLTGEQVKCHVMNTLLEDIHFEYRPESEKGEYYDDGTHGDLLADDNIYTNISERNDVLSPEANRLKRVYLRMLSLVEETNPIEFFRIPVAIEEPLSRLPRMSDEERDRDETYLREWHQRFLAMYRQDPEDPMSDFYPIFVPSPPRPPETPSPPDEEFSPGAFALDDFILRTVEGATAPAIEPEPEPGGGYGSEYSRPARSARRGGGEDSYGGGDRYSRARREATRYGTYQGSSYYRR